VSRAPSALRASYLVPVSAPAPDLALVAYLDDVAAWVDDVIVVDGSPPAVFAEHAGRLSPSVRHVAPTVRTAMGKVGGVLTGAELARHDVVVIADDDVEWDRPLLERALAGLGDADVGRPQQVFRPAPWHARWDTGRMLLNRATSGDWPGTMVVRRDVLRAGYAGEALFENLELVRSVRARGGRERVLLDVVVPRRPPSATRFLEQRVRQAYDEWARPWRLVLQLSWLPLALRRPRWLPAMAVGLIAMAEVGRRRAGGRAHWRPTAPLWAVPWAAERAVTSWLALGARARGGARYRGRRLPLAAHSVRQLRAAASPDRPPRSDRTPASTGDRTPASPAAGVAATVP
jgi:hypothetical protein